MISGAADVLFDELDDDWDAVTFDDLYTPGSYWVNPPSPRTVDGRHADPWTGEVVEYYGLTEIKVEADDPDHSVVIVDSAPVTMVPYETTTGAIGEGCNADGESHEGLLVTVRNVQLLSEANNWGEITIDDGSGPSQLEDGLLGAWFSGEVVKMRHPPKSGSKALARCADLLAAFGAHNGRARAEAGKPSYATSAPG